MKYCLALVVLLLFSIPAAFSVDNCFPDEKHLITSPSNKYQLSWKKGDHAEREDEHHYLFFCRKGEKEPHKFFEFYNEACVHWSPDEKYFTISHLIGSNIAEDFIFESNDISQRVDVMDALPNNLRNFFRKGILHGYIKTVRWNQDGLFVRTWGDRENEPRTFDVTLKCSVQQNKWVCKNTAN